MVFRRLRRYRSFPNLGLDEEKNNEELLSNEDVNQDEDSGVVSPQQSQQSTPTVGFSATSLSSPRPLVPSANGSTGTMRQFSAMGFRRLLCRSVVRSAVKEDDSVSWTSSSMSSRSNTIATDDISSFGNSARQRNDNSNEKRRSVRFDLAKNTEHVNTEWTVQDTKDLFYSQEECKSFKMSNIALAQFFGAKQPRQQREACCRILESLKKWGDNLIVLYGYGGDDDVSCNKFDNAIKVACAHTRILWQETITGNSSDHISKEDILLYLTGLEQLILPQSERGRFLRKKILVQAVLEVQQQHRRRKARRQQQGHRVHEEEYVEADNNEEDCTSPEVDEVIRQHCRRISLPSEMFARIIATTEANEVEL